MTVASPYGRPLAALSSPNIFHQRYCDDHISSISLSGFPLRTFFFFFIQIFTRHRRATEYDLGLRSEKLLIFRAPTLNKQMIVHSNNETLSTN